MTPERHKKLQAVLARRQPDLTVLMESVHKPHNLSAIVRTCDAVGVLGIHAVPSRDGLDLSRASAGGALKWVDVIRHVDIGAAASTLKANGFRIVGAHLDEDAVDYRTEDFTGPTAFLMGTELDGLSPDALECVDRMVTVPMMGMVPSLNVSVATALLLYEAYRQRDRRGFYDRPRLSVSTRARLLFEWGYPRLSRKLRSQGRPYPELDDDGRVVGDAGMGDDARAAAREDGLDPAVSLMDTAE